MTHAVVLSDRPHDVAGVLVMLDDKGEAEQIAVEMRRGGHNVEARQVNERLADRTEDAAVVGRRLVLIGMSHGRPAVEGLGETACFAPQ
jgi:hypothetical protein